MKNIVAILTAVILLNGMFGCRSTKKLQTAINKKDTQIVSVVHTPTSSPDSLKEARAVMSHLTDHRIDFNTFSAKIKVDYEDTKGKLPSVMAYVRMTKDSVMWISIVGSLAFITKEAYRIMITKDHITILDKLHEEVEDRPFSFIEEFAKIPLDFKVLQDIIIGNAIYTGDKIVSYKLTENHILLSTIGKYFKNLMTLSAENNNLIERSKLDDLDPNLNRTADLTYSEYENKGFFFSTYREITVAEKTKVDIRLTFKQYDFNTELSYPFSIPKNYKTK